MYALAPSRRAPTLHDFLSGRSQISEGDETFSPHRAMKTATGQLFTHWFMAEAQCWFMQGSHWVASGAA